MLNRIHKRVGGRKPTLPHLGEVRLLKCDRTTTPSGQCNSRGPTDETDGLYYDEAKRGTTAFHAYATLYARVRNKRYTLAVRHVTHGDTASV